MRKVTFYIDDVEYFERQCPKIKEISHQMLRFKAILTLMGSGKFVDKYKLTDYKGNKISINSLNGFQKGVIKSDCYSYFEGRPYCLNDTNPCGVIKIIDQEIDENGGYITKILEYKNGEMCYGL